MQAIWYDANKSCFQERMIGIDNTARARFLTSLGSLNNYSSTVYQTKLALDQESTAPLQQNNDDVAIFQDALKGIEAIRQTGFNSDGIIAVNAAFDSPSAEQPSMPGHLRNAFYNDDDKTAIILGRRGNAAYFPPDVVTRADLDQIVTDFQRSDRSEHEAWRVFARLAKLQPFQDGNKRTALIAANAAYQTWDTGNYLILPTHDLDLDLFMNMLMRYYAAEPEEEEQFLTQMIALLPNAADRLAELGAPITPDQPNAPHTIRYHRKFR